MKDVDKDILVSLRSSPAFSGVGEAHLSRIASKGVKRSVRQGERLALHGESVQSVFLIIEGVISCSCEDALTAEKTEFKVHKGQAVNLDALIFDPGAARSHFGATCESQTGVVIEIQADVLRDIVGFEISEEVALGELGKLLSLQNDSVVCNYLSSSSDLLSMITVHSYKDGDQIFKEGDPSGDVFYILGGSVRITRKADRSWEEDIASLGSDSIFGELGALTKQPRSGSAYSVGTSSVLKLDGFLYRKMLSESDKVCQKVERQQSFYAQKSVTEARGKTGKLLSFLRGKVGLPALTAAMVFASSGVIAYKASDMVLGTIESNLQTQAQQVLLEGKGALESYIQDMDEALAAMDASISEAFEEDFSKVDRALKHANYDLLYVAKNHPSSTFGFGDTDAAIKTIVDSAALDSLDMSYHPVAHEGRTIFVKVLPVVIQDEAVGSIVNIFDPKKGLGGVPLAISGDSRFAEEMAFGDSKIMLSPSTISNLDWLDELSKHLFVVLMAFAGALSAVSYLLAFAYQSFAVRTKGSERLEELEHAVNRLEQGQRGLHVPFVKDKIYGPLAQSISKLQQSLELQERTASNRLLDSQKRDRRQKEVHAAIGIFQGEVAEKMVDLEGCIKAISTVSHSLDQEASSSKEAFGEIAAIYNTIKDKVVDMEQLVESLNASIHTIGGKAVSSEKTLSDAVCQANVANEKVDQLAESIESIVEIVGSISDIAEKTRLLSLNARVEAAKAGEAGRGFSVVAQEVSSLADSVSKSTDEINERISTTVVAKDVVHETLQSLESAMSQMTIEQREVKEAVDQQIISTKQIAEQARETSYSTLSIADKMSGMHKLSETVRVNSSSLKSQARTLNRQSGGLLNNIKDFIEMVRS